MTVDIEHLRKLTAENIERIRKEREAKEKEKELAEILAKKRIDDKRYNNIVDLMPSLTEEAAKQGKNFIKIELDHTQGDLIYGGKDEKFLQRVGKRVFDYCKELGLNPQVKTYYDGLEEKEYFYIKIEW